MAVYFLRCKHVSRKEGSRVTRAAAYRSGGRIRDERTSEVYDHSDRDDVVYKEVVLPADLAGCDDMAWTQDRSTLWNAAEHAGRRRDSCLAREWLVLVPQELTARQRSQLVSTFARELAGSERERLSGPSEAQTPRTRERDVESTSPDDDDDDRKRRRQHDHDFGL